MNHKELRDLPGLLTFVIVAPALWTIVGIIAFVEGHLLRWPKAFWYPFFTGTSFTDFTIFRPQFAAFRTPHFWQPRGFPFTYPAPSALAFEGFFSIPRHHLGAFLLFILASALVAAIASGVVLHRRGLGFYSALVFAGVALISSYPFMCLFDRANIEIVNWIFVSLAVAALWCERWKLAGTLLGVAISLKLFPFILLGLFLARKKFTAIFIAIAVAAALDIVSLAILGPTIKIAYQHISLGLKYFQNQYIYGFHPFEIPFDHSYFAVVKHLAEHTRMADPTHLALFAHWYMVMAAAGGLLLYFTRIIRLPRINQIVILLALSVLLPPVSGDYNLVHLYAGWLALALFTIEVEPGVIRTRVLPACFLLLAIAFCPETYMLVGQAHIAGSFKALALSLLIILLLVYRLEEKRPQPAEGNALG